MKDKIIQKDSETVQLDQTGTETLVALLSSKTKTEAAEKLQVHRNTVAERIEKYGLDEIIAQIPKRALQTLQMGSDLAAETMINKLSDRQQGLEAAKEILNRVGVGGAKETIGVSMKQGDSIMGLIIIKDK